MNASYDWNWARWLRSVFGDGVTLVEAPPLRRSFQWWDAWAGARAHPWGLG